MSHHNIIRCDSSKRPQQNITIESTRIQQQNKSSVLPTPEKWLLLRVSILTTKLLGGKQMTSLFHCYPLGLRDFFAILTMTCFLFFCFFLLFHLSCYIMLISINLQFINIFRQNSYRLTCFGLSRQKRTTNTEYYNKRIPHIVDNGLMQSLEEL